MEPFERLALIGLDVNFAVTQSIYRVYLHEPCFQPQPIQQRMVDASTPGRKTRHGFYEYHTENKP
jgi:3-hydroxybutyryl-CoA dehydrogenase